MYQDAPRHLSTIRRLAHDRSRWHDRLTTHGCQVSSIIDNKHACQRVIRPMIHLINSSQKLINRLNRSIKYVCQWHRLYDAHPQYVRTYSEMKQYAGLTEQSHLLRLSSLVTANLTKQRSFEGYLTILKELPCPCCALQAAFLLLLIEHLVRTFSA
jgi:lysyl-tRNA synthetase class I